MTYSSLFLQQLTRFMSMPLLLLYINAVRSQLCKMLYFNVILMCHLSHGTNLKTICVCLHDRTTNLTQYAVENETTIDDDDDDDEELDVCERERERAGRFIQFIWNSNT